MLTVIGTNIRIPQGESGEVNFLFKNKVTDEPLILQKLPDIKSLQEAIVFEIKNALNNKANTSVLAKYYFLQNDESVGLWHKFNEGEILDAPGLLEKWKTNVLYREKVGDAYQYVYYPTDTRDEKVVYDYTDSSLNVQFDRDDTINLIPKTYFYEISYITGYNLGEKNEDIRSKTTFLDPTEFTVSGALK